MFDQNVESEGLGRSDAAMDAERAPMGHAPSPDGLGAYANPQPGDAYPAQSAAGEYYTPMNDAPAPTNGLAPTGEYYTPMNGLDGQIDFLEPTDTSRGAAMRSSGFTLLFVALATGAGYAWRGGHGAISGLLVAAGLANGYRAQKWFNSPDPSEKHEAIVSSIFSAGEVVGGLYIGYQASQRRAAER